MKIRKRYELRLRPTQTAIELNPSGAALVAVHARSQPPIDRFWTRRGAEAALRRLRPSLFGVLVEPYVVEVPR